MGFNFIVYFVQIYIYKKKKTPQVPHQQHTSPVLAVVNATTGLLRHVYSNINTKNNFDALRNTDTNTGPSSHP